MAEKDYIVIGGKKYDPSTGLLIERQEQPTANKKPQQSTKSTIKTTAKKSRTQKAKTLNRDYVKKPTFNPKTVDQIIHKRAVTPPRSAKPAKPAAKNLTNNFKNRQIRHFAKLEEVTKQQPKTPVVLTETTNPDYKLDQAAQQQFITNFNQARKANFYTRYRINQISKQRRAQQLKLLKQSQAIQKSNKKSTQKAKSKSLKQIKNETLIRAIAQAPSTKDLNKYRPHQNKFKLFWRQNRAFVLTIIAAIIIGSGLFYLNLPNLKLKYANHQAQIIATYPSAMPIGFKLTQMAEYSDDQISFNYQEGNRQISFSQKATDWNPQTLLEVTVKPESKDNYITDKQRGLTIYYFDKTAIWINGGILYRIDYNYDIDPYDLREIVNSF